MKRVRELQSENANETESKISVKRLKELPPTHEKITPFVRKIHTALDGTALTTVQYPHDTCFCLFRLMSPPVVVTRSRIKALLAIDSLDFMLYKGQDHRSIILQVDTNPSQGRAIESTKHEEKEPSKGTNETTQTKTIPQLEGLTANETKLIRWMNSVKPFDFKVQKNNHKGITFTATTTNQKMEKMFFEDVEEIMLNEWFHDYRVSLKDEHLCILFKV